MSEQQKCFFCGHSITQHDFSHSSECRTKGCDCDEFIYETRKCDLCDKIVDRNRLSELMLNPHMQLISLCEEHFKYDELFERERKFENDTGGVGELNLYEFEVEEEKW